MREGKEYEAALLGQVKRSAYGRELLLNNKDNPEIKENFLRYAVQPSMTIEFFEETHFSFEKAVKMVKNSQPWEDPHHPKKEFTILLMDKLSKESGVPRECIYYYTGVESALDRFHNVDYFIIFKIGDKEELVKVDITMDPNKPTNNADLILVYKKDILENRQSMNEFVEESFHSIVNQVIYRQKKARY